MFPLQPIRIAVAFVAVIAGLGCSCSQGENQEDTRSSSAPGETDGPGIVEKTLPLNPKQDVPVPPAPVEPPAQSVNVLLKIDALHVVKHTNDDDRDEVYIVVASDNYYKRFPSDNDYYEGYNGTHLQDRGWTRKDGQPHDQPLLWGGDLQPGESRTWLVAIGEQDRDDPWVGKYSYGSSPKPPTWTMLKGDIKGNQHDFIGGFTITAHDEAGRLVVDSWSGFPGTAYTGNDPSRGPNAAYFVANGDHDSQYNVVANIVPSHDAHVDKPTQPPTPVQQTPVQQKQLNNIYPK